jgi:hypothetical protein
MQGGTGRGEADVGSPGGGGGGGDIPEASPDDDDPPAAVDDAPNTAAAAAAAADTAAYDEAPSTPRTPGGRPVHRTGGDEENEAPRSHHRSTTVGEAKAKEARVGGSGSSSVGGSSGVRYGNDVGRDGDIVTRGRGEGDAVQRTLHTAPKSSATAAAAGATLARASTPHQRQSPRLSCISTATAAQGVASFKGGGVQALGFTTSSAHRQQSATVLAADPEFGRRIRVLGKGDNVGGLRPLLLPGASPSPWSAVAVAACEVCVP